MKPRRNIVVLILAALALVSCNDKFLQEDPIQDISEGVALSSEMELSIYLNGLYSRYVEGHQDGWSDKTSAPFSVTGSHLVYGDFMSDNLVTKGNVTDRLDGSYLTPVSGGGNGWEWENLRNVNYFLRNYKKALPAVGNDPAKLDKYLGEALFFKAWEYYKKVMIFGDVPWFTLDFNIDSDRLQASRDSRTVVMDSVMWCIDQAFEKLPAMTSKSAANGRINKDMAAFLKARIALFEGSFRTYHTELGLQSTAGRWLEAAVEASNYLMAGNRYALYKKGPDSYWKLFTFKNNPASDGNTEAILARTYDGVRLGHATQRYFDQNTTGGATRGLVDEYLCIDGNPIYIGGTEGAYFPNPNFKGYDGMWSEMENRDPRLMQTIGYPGQYRSIFNRTTGKWGQEENGITYPRLSYNNGSSMVTGYSIVKHWMGDRTENELVTLGQQTAIEFRYAELLLINAEAKAILGKITQQDLDNTINKLRERAGFDFAKYPGSRLVMGSEPKDPRLDKIYSDKLDYPVSPLLREIRRERRVEMCVEGLRYEDLMRWKAGKLLTIPLRGMKFTEAKKALYDGSHTSKPLIAVKEEVGKDIFLDTEGFIIAYPKSPRITDGTLPWEDKRYYWPLPLDDLNLNKNLVQNTGWQGAK
ncbi:RagB/SusD family nutrient uptake outer membrane protein [Sphingobacterium sp. CZ-UAM]|uniref:RagB/SusD family nutrient uptake outer membrane protein n=1 Tax=Sphingobacterium sp. CZ-UAM TaxID=1933868 RepID=UPI000984F4C4|nr:RagB/SusD family nutrient uptake outer membrane protein [Sphingobacterium sp. CZ-UAM]OOG19761.1 RagB/SusD family nutrient uptake outer membrane protein [Sphingobacterium sp. CZ-UAM]